MESIDYPDFVKKFVKEKIAQFDLKATDEVALYVTQDVESYLLDSGKRVEQLTETELFHIDKFIRDRVEGIDGI